MSAAPIKSLSSKEGAISVLISAVQWGALTGIDPEKVMTTPTVVESRIIARELWHVSRPCSSFNY